MLAAVITMAMSSSFFSPGFAFSSQFDSDGASPSELSWPSSLAVLAVSFSGLFTFVFLMLACLCCKKEDIGFKEFENAEGDEYPADLSTLASPASQTSPEVYILPLTEVSLPVSKQPGRSVQLLKSTDLGRHSLLYLKEIGHGWFGKVLLGEVNSGLSAMQVVVKELKASASVQDQMQFLEEAQPYRALQHPNLLQCLAQCTEVTPYLLVMEFCPLGDLKAYLRSCRGADAVTPDPLTLQRMACEITSGLLHLHKHNFIHSDLALRNCLLTAEATVKIGDYGLSHHNYKEDYFVTSDQLWVPLRWIAPELVDEVHGNLLVVDQTKSGNIWSLGVTMWELLELGNQPYRQYSDRQVLTYVVKEQQLKLAKPLMKAPLADRWYEVMQFCWLQPDQRPTAEEVHLLLSYLCAKGVSEAEEDFEKRWNSMRPNNSHCAGLSSSCSSSSFPLLERFSTGDSYQPEPGDDVLTVTETSHGLNFEYKWEQARHELPYRSSSTSGPLGQGNPHYQDIYYPSVGTCAPDGLTLGVSPSFYESKQLHTPGVVPVLSVHSPSVSSEYYIRIEEPVDCHIERDYAVCPYSPGFEGSGDGGFVVTSGDSVGCIKCPMEAQPGSYWSADIHKASAYDSDNSPAISLTMEPLLGQVCSPMQPWESGHYVSYKDCDGGYYYDSSPSMEMDQYLTEDNVEPQQESWGSRSLRQALGELENPLGISPSLSDPRRGYSDPCMAGECYYDMLGSLRKTMPRPHSVSIGPEGSLLQAQRDSDLEEEDLFVERDTRSWASNRSANNNSLNFTRRPMRCSQEAYIDYHYTMPSTDVEDLWPQMNIKERLMFRANNPLCYPDNGGCLTLSKHHTLISSRECNTCVYPCHDADEDAVSPVKCHQAVDARQFVDPLCGTLVRNYTLSDYIREKKSEPFHIDKTKTLPTTLSSSLIGECLLSKSQMSDMNGAPLGLEHPEQQTGLGGEVSGKKSMEKVMTSLKDVKFMTQSIHIGPEKLAAPDTVSENSQPADSGLDRGCSSISLVDIDDCSDEDITDVTSGIFADYIMDYSDSGNAPAASNHQNHVGTPDSVDSIDLTSAAGSCDTLSPAFDTSSPPKALDSGYDTENNESPEFVMKEPLEPRDPEGFAPPLVKPSLCENTTTGITDAKVVLEAELDDNIVPIVHLSLSHSTELELTNQSEKNPCRDSAYFSDYDTENERFSKDEEDDLLDKLDSDNVAEQEGSNRATTKPMEKESLDSLQLEKEEGDWKSNGEDHKEMDMDLKKLSPRGELSQTNVCGSSSEAIFSKLSPSPPEMGGCLTKECSQDEGLGLDSDNSGDEPSSECSSSTVSEGMSSQQQPATSADGGIVSVGSEDVLAEPLISYSASEDSITEAPSEINDEVMREQAEPAETVDLPKEEEEQGDTSSRSINEDQKAQTQDTELDGLMDTTRSPCPSSPPPPLPPIESRISPGDGEEADSEDSEESDEELRCYNVHEQSEESEEESPAVPVVLSDCSDARHLRSLLKMPNLLTESFSDEFDRKKKAVSFFDDVTVFLFDQESPTRELAEHGFPSGAESCGQGADSQESGPPEKVNASDDSSDGNISEESAGLEWEDDFPLLPNASAMTATRSILEKPPSHSQPAVTLEPQPAVQFSRFTVSPSPVSRFSITHVSDSDIDSAGGSSEDGERD